MPQEQNQIFVSLQLQTDNVGYLNSVKFETLETQVQSKKKTKKDREYNFKLILVNKVEQSKAGANDQSQAQSR